MELFKSSIEVTAALTEKGLHSWATLHTMALVEQIATIGDEDLPPTHYKAAHLYKSLKHADWGHENPGRERRLPVSTNLLVGKNSADAAEAINQLAVSVSRRSLKAAQIKGLERLGVQLLSHAQEMLKTQQAELRRAS